MAAARRQKRRRQRISLGVKRLIVRLKDSGMTWRVVLSQHPVPVTRDTARHIMRSAERYRDLPNDPSVLGRVNYRGPKWPELDTLLFQWYLALYSFGHRRIPITTALLQKAAAMIAAKLGIAGFSASNGFVRGFLARHNICNLSMHGQAGSVNVAEAAAAVDAIRRQLEGFELT